MAESWERVDGGAILAFGRNVKRVEISSTVKVPRTMTAVYRNQTRGLVVELDVVVVDARPLVQGLRVKGRTDDKRGIDSGRLHAIPVADLLYRTVVDASLVRQPDGTTWVGGDNDASDVPPVKRTRRLTHAELQEVADVYLSHQGRGPTKAVAEAFHLSRDGAAKRVRQAREAGLIPRTTKGRANRTTRKDDR